MKPPSLLFYLTLSLGLMGSCAATGFETDLSFASPSELQARKDRLQRVESKLTIPSEAVQEEAIKELQVLSDEGDPGAKFALGNLYLSGSPRLKLSIATGARLLREAAESGDGKAILNYASLLDSGISIAEPRDASIKWASRVIEHPELLLSRKQKDKSKALFTGPEDLTKFERSFLDFAHFIVGRRLFEKKRFAEALPHLEAVTRTNENRFGGHAGRLAATCYALGKGVGVDRKRALELLRETKPVVLRRREYSPLGIFQIPFVWGPGVADQDWDPYSQDPAPEVVDAGKVENALGHAEMISEAFSKKEAGLMLELAAETGNPEDVTALAESIAFGLYHPKNPARAFELYRSASAGNAVARANTLIGYAKGIGTPPNRGRSLAVCSQCSNTELVSHLYAIGKCPSRLIQAEDLWHLVIDLASKDDRVALYVKATSALHISMVDPYLKNIDRPDERLLEKAAEAGFAPAMRDLAVLRLSRVGDHAPGEAEKLLLLLRRAAENGDVDAVAQYCQIISSGDFGTPAPESAEAFYRTVVEKLPRSEKLLVLEGYFCSRHAQGFHATGDTEKEIDSWKKARAAWEEAKALPQAKYNLALLYLGSENLGLQTPPGVITPDINQALRLLEEAAENGHARANFVLGSLYLRGKGAKTDLNRARSFLATASYLGNAEAKELLGLVYLRGEGVDANVLAALRHAWRLAPSSASPLPRMICDQLLREKEYACANFLLNIAASSPDPSTRAFAEHRLHLCQSRGWGQKLDRSKAAEHFAKALQGEDPDALIEEAGNALEAGEGPRAFSLFSKAAPRSNRGLAFLGTCYLKGTGTPKNDKKAIELLSQAAANEEPLALFELASLTQNKVDGAPDVETAIRYAELALKKEHPGAAVLRQALLDQRASLGR